MNIRFLNVQNILTLMGTATIAFSAASCTHRRSIEYVSTFFTIQLHTPANVLPDTGVSICVNAIAPNAEGCQMEISNTATGQSTNLFVNVGEFCKGVSWLGERRFKLVKIEAENVTLQRFRIR